MAREIGATPTLYICGPLVPGLPSPRGPAALFVPARDRRGRATVPRYDPGVAHRGRTVVAMLLVSFLTACGGDGDEEAGSGSATSTTASSTAPPAGPSSTTTTQPPIEGVETFMVDAGHREGPLTYPQTPPVGGIHNPVWTPCTFYDRAVPNENAVHSLEHGAIWITYRPDLPREQIDLLAALARSRRDVLVSLWEEGLPSPLVATAWGRQLRLESATDPRLTEFVRRYANQGPEINAPC